MRHKTSYYSVGFNYPGPHDNVPHDSTIAAQHNNWAAECAVEQACEILGLGCKHENSWPDGSLYKWIRCNLSEDALREVINAVLPDAIFAEDIRHISRYKWSMRHYDPVAEAEEAIDDYYVLD